MKLYKTNSHASIITYLFLIPIILFFNINQALSADTLLLNKIEPFDEFIQGRDRVLIFKDENTNQTSYYTSDGIAYSSGECMEDNSEGQFFGTLVQEKFKNSDLGFFKNRKVNKKNYSLVVNMDKYPLICMQGIDTHNRDWGKQVQVILSPKEYKKYKSLVGEKITLAGRLNRANKRYHHKLLVFTDIRFINKANN